MEEIKDLERAAIEQGWRVTRGAKQSWIFWPPNRTIRFSSFAGTPSDHHALRNFIADLRRKGFIWPWPPEKGRR